MRTVELLLDPGLDHGVRELWERLHDAGFPSLATHPHPTNRPHLTVLTAGSIDGLPPLPLPVAAQLGEVRLLGRALVRAVTATAELRDLHTRAWSALAGGRSSPDGTDPGGSEPWPPPPEWVPHVSLALKVPAERHGEALELLATLPPAHGRFVAARSYNTRTRMVFDL